MPRSKAKSCRNCRAAKTSCSLAVPCLRCSRRRLDCNYGPTQHSPPAQTWLDGEFRPIRPAIATGGKDHSGRSVVTVDAGSRSEASDITGQHWDHLSKPLEMPVMNWGPAPERTSALQTSSPDTVGVTSTYPFTYSLSPPLTFLSDLLSIPGDTTSEDLAFSQRLRTVVQGSLTAKMLTGQISDFPRMMASGKQLPPFIYPPCSLSRGGSGCCPADSAHLCLPETLAVCTSLVQMFYSRTPGSSSFVWEQIYAHMYRLNAQYESQDAETILQTLQTLIIYNLLQLKANDPRTRSNATMLNSVTEKVARKSFSMIPYCLDEETLFTERSSWVVMESLRRVGCLFYMIDLLFHIDGQLPTKGQCPECIDLPLPCNRELWESASDRDWQKCYHQHVSAKSGHGKQGLTLGSLILMRDSLLRGGEKFDNNSWRAGVSEELAAWCEKADDFSMLLWMAFMIEGHGQPVLRASM